MGKNKSSKNTKKSSASKKDRATKDALAVTSANIARIEAAERGEPTTDSASDAVPVDQVTKQSKPSKLKGKAPKTEKPVKAKKEKPARKPSLLDHAVAILKKAAEP